MLLACWTLSRWVLSLSWFKLHLIGTLDWPLSRLQIAIRFVGFLGGLALAVVRVLNTVVVVNDHFEKPHEHSSYSFHTYPSCDWNRCVFGVET